MKIAFPVLIALCLVLLLGVLLGVSSCECARYGAPTEYYPLTLAVVPDAFRDDASRADPDRMSEEIHRVLSENVAPVLSSDSILLSHYWQHTPGGSKEIVFSGEWATAYGLLPVDVQDCVSEFRPGAGMARSICVRYSARGPARESLTDVRLHVRVCLREADPEAPSASSEPLPPAGSEPTGWYDEHWVMDPRVIRCCIADLVIALNLTLVE